jgi:hypothetical protein
MCLVAGVKDRMDPRDVGNKQTQNVKNSSMGLLHPSNGQKTLNTLAQLAPSTSDTGYSANFSGSPAWVEQCMECKTGSKAAAVVAAAVNGSDKVEEVDKPTAYISLALLGLAIMGAFTLMAR